MSKKKKKKDDVVIKEEFEKFDYMKTVKNNINNVLKDKAILPIINDLVIRTNKIVIHSCNFIKLYCIYLYENDLEFPLIDKNFICDVFKVITKRKDNRGATPEKDYSDLLKNLYKFYNEHYITTIYDNEIIYYDKLSYILAYEAIDIEKNINNNIQEHFITHLNQFVNHSFNLQEQKDEIKKIKDKEARKERYKSLTNEFKKVKDDLVSLTNDLKADEKYHNWIKEHKIYIIPNKTNFDKDSIYYDLKSNTKDYLKSFIYINIQLEKLNNKLLENTEDIDKIKQIKLFNVLPLRSNIIPKNICIDTCALISNFLGDESTSIHLKNYKKEDNQFKLWNRFLKLDNKIFKKNKYVFNYMIRTDSISVSILFIKLGNNGLPLTYNNPNNKPEENTKYIEKEIITDELRSKKIVCIDPGCSDLIYCGSKDENDKLQTFRYTQNQRRLETRTKKYNKIIEEVNNTTFINGKNIKEIESVLSNHNKRTCHYENFKNYLIEKNKLNLLLFSHYEKTFFRKLKLNRYINTQKSESKMIKNFTKKFGEPNDIIIAMGDYDKENNNMSGLEPTICKKFRKIFKNAGFRTYLVNEFRTSKLCNCCHHEIKPFMIRQSHKPNNIKVNKKITINGLLSHQEDKQKCEIIHNRDKNAVQNMLNIVKSIFTIGKRPDIFMRIHT
jgi:hypothetical protein